MIYSVLLIHIISCQLMLINKVHVDFNDSRLFHNSVNCFRTVFQVREKVKLYRYFHSINGMILFSCYYYLVSTLQRVTLGFQVFIV